MRDITVRPRPPLQDVHATMFDDHAEDLIEQLRDSSYDIIHLKKDDGHSVFFRRDDILSVVICPSYLFG